MGRTLRSLCLYELLLSGRTAELLLQIGHREKPLVSSYWPVRRGAMLIGRTEQPGSSLAELSPDGTSGRGVMVAAAKMGRAGSMEVAAEVAGAGRLAVEEAVVFRGL